MTQYAAPPAAATDVPVHCPICAHSVVVALFDGSLQPLATLGWPQSAAEARAMRRHPHDFVQCPACSHVWNRSFHYEAVPYRNNPNRMFNQGLHWQGHLAHTRDRLLARLPDAPAIVEIGCGEGHFLRGLADARNRRGRFVGFDPNASPQTGLGVEFNARLFEPLVDMPRYAPDAVIIRHVLEHLTHPAVLVDQLAWGAAALDKPCWLFAEMPCIDRVFETDRLVDFYYEHAAHFTTLSFSTLMARAGEVAEVAHGYDGEVVYGLVMLGVPAAARERARVAQAYERRTVESRATIRAQLDALAASGARVAIWGGTGKSAAFIHQFHADAARFPLVVDSDPDKAGTFVPGSGQEIMFRDVLKRVPVDVVIITTQWRAQDIAAEMAREGIVAAQVLVEHGGRLVAFQPHAMPLSGEA